MAGRVKRVTASGSGWIRSNSYEVRNYPLILLPLEAWDKHGCHGELEASLGAFKGATGMFISPRG